MLTNDPDFHPHALRDSSLRAENLAIIRRMCLNAYLGDWRSVCRVLGRFNVFIDTRDKSHAIRLLMEGYWEIHVTEVLARSLEPGMTMLDVGANYGYFSVLAGTLIGDQGRLLCFEPHPDTAEMLRDTLRVNGLKARSTVYELALADRDAADQVFSMKPGKPMTARLVEHEPADAELSTCKVRTARLDSLSDLPPRLDVMKIDIEGAEEQFWAGAAETIARNRDLRILLEVNSKRYADPRRFYESILDQGFRLAEIRPDARLRPITIDHLLSEREGLQWMLFLERDPVSGWI